jgi:deoxycytidylate deaminase
MAEKVGQLSFETPKRDNTKSINELLDYTETEELIIGLCGPIGTDIDFVSKHLTSILEDDFGYKCEEIKLSTFIRKRYKIKKQTSKTFDSVKELIDKGNKLRGDHKNDILAKLVINRIAQIREENSKTDAEVFKSKRVCYIINSIKHISEYNLLKRVYSNIFYFIGVFSPLEVRKDNLKEISKPDIEKLIEIDYNQEEVNGQKVSKTFPNADYFLRIEESHDSEIEKPLQRFLDLIFGTKIVTPTYKETAMYMASSASANSACLSRQVGASITNEKGDIISVGWNDVPKYGGNLYTSNDIPSKDYRCINKDGGKCFNDEEKNLLTDLLTKKLIEKKIINSSQKEGVVDILNDSRIKDLIEFSRAVHAEMHAIINATQKSGSEIVNGKLFCTTYPCHNCARHIVAAGIKEVYFIEPYKKSLAIKLHSDSLTERENSIDRVKVLMYDGVSPRRYINLFKVQGGEKRKKDGLKTLPKRKEASPRKTLSLDAIPFLEYKATEELKENDTFDNVIN